MSRHRFHGDEARFEVVAELVYEHFGGEVQTIADVAGGRGMLSRILRKKYNFDSEVVDTRGWALKGVPSRRAEFEPGMAVYYDLIVGLHPDQATRPIAEAALIRPALLIPCCNFWSAEKLGKEELLAAIQAFYEQNRVRCERLELTMKGPHRVALLSRPPV